MSKFTTQPKSIQIAKAFKCSNASVALYAEHSLNETKIHFSNRFYQGMLNTNLKLSSKLSHNIHRNFDTLEHYPEGIALTMNAATEAHMSSTGTDPTGLGRWTWTRLERRYKIFFIFISTYCPCTSKSGLSTTWSQHV